MENLLPLILLVIYLVLQFVGSRKKPEPGQGAPPGRPPEGRRVPPDEHTGNPLEDALREIREALGADTEPERRRPAERAEAESPLPSVSPSAPTRLERRLPDEPARLPAEPPRLGGGDGRPTKPKRRERGGFADEEAFERQPIPDLPPPPKATPPVRARRPAKPKPPAPLPSDEREALLGRLRDPQSARDAVVLSEVLGPPRSQRPRR